MRMRVHELHAAVIHAPLVLFPSATVADMLALGERDWGWARAGRTLWIAGTVSGLLAGVAGLAASQEVKVQEPTPRDMMFLHGMGNVLITTGALAVTLWRLRNPPSLVQCLVGLAACGAALYTGGLGGKMVYDHGVGVGAMPVHGQEGVYLQTPALFSREAPRALVRDAARGLGWLFGRARDLFTRRQPLEPTAKGFELRHRAPAEAYAPAHGVSQMPVPPG